MERIPEYPEHEHPTSRVVKLGEESGSFLNFSDTPSFSDHIEPQCCTDKQVHGSKSQESALEKRSISEMSDPTLLPRGQSRINFGTGDRSIDSTDVARYTSQDSTFEHRSITEISSLSFLPAAQPRANFGTGEGAVDSDVFGTIPASMFEGGDVETLMRQYFNILFSKLDSQFARLEMLMNNNGGLNSVGLAQTTTPSIHKVPSGRGRLNYATTKSTSKMSDLQADKFHTERTWEPAPAYKQTEATERAKRMANSRKTIFVASERLFNNKSARDVWQHPNVEWFIGVMIVLNAVFIGYETDYRARSIGEHTPMWIFGVGTFFTAIFAVELVFKIYFDRLAMFRLDQIFWSVLDIVIVTMSLFELAFENLPEGAISSSGVKSTNQFRVLRMVRMTRLIRVIRVARVIKIIRALRTLVHQLAHTTKSLLWGLALLTLVVFLFGVFFTQNVTTYREDNGAVAGDVIADSVSPMIRYWSTVPRSMKTLYMCITGGVNWIEVVAPLSDLSTWSVALFVGYIAFVQFAVLNVITGVFCQNAIESARRDQDLVMHAILQEKEMYTDRLRAIFQELDSDGSGTLTLEEFQERLENQRLQAYFASLDLEISDVRVFFKLVDLNGGEDIDIEEFIASCLRLRGTARSVDLAKLMHDQRRMNRRFEDFVAQTTEVFKRLPPQRRGVLGAT